MKTIKSKDKYLEDIKRNNGKCYIAVENDKNSF